MPGLRPFHLAIPVADLVAARAFYGELLECPEGRSAAQWVDFDFFGHQLVCHQVEHHDSVAGRNPVDGESIPVPHFGVVLTRAQWDAAAARFRSVGHRFVVAPTVRFEDTPGEQATFFVADPSGNVLEFKAFADLDQLFAR
ncbi:MAG: VOC family protein [Pseudomonadota bacterium]